MLNYYRIEVVSSKSFPFKQNLVRKKLFHSVNKVGVLERNVSPKQNFYNLDYRNQFSNNLLHKFPSFGQFQSIRLFSGSSVYFQENTTPKDLPPTVATSVETQNIPSESVPFLDSVPLENVQGVIDGLSSSMLQSSNIIDYFSPKYLLDSFLFLLHDSLNMPWWLVIVILSLLSRMILLPIVVINLRKAPEMKSKVESITSLAVQMNLAKETNDTEKISLLGKKYFQEISSYFGNIGRSLLPLPVFILCFLELQELFSTNIPSITTEGILWFQNLSLPDPYYRLPFLSSLATIILIKFGADIPVSNQRVMLPIMVLFSSFGMFFTRNLPMGIHLYWTSTAVISILQVFLLNKTFLKRIFKIPDPEGIKFNPTLYETLKEAKEAKLNIMKKATTKTTDQIKNQTISDVKKPKTMNQTISDVKKPKTMNPTIKKK